MPVSSSVVDTQAARVAWLDTVRVLACFLVILCHCTDGFFPSNNARHVETGAALFVTGVRACVPLFVMISGALLLPMRGDAETFLKRRFSRIVVPFLIWGVVLALLPLPGPESAWAPGNLLKDRVAAGRLPLMLYNVLMLPFNFTDTNIHFWFLYIILGLYLFVPVISPWIRQATTKGLVAFLGVWAFTLFLPYLQHWPRNAVFPALHGECDWNTHGATHYFGGYLGYFVLGHFMMTRLPAWKPSRAMIAGVAMFVAGWVFTYGGYQWTVANRATDKELEFFIEFLSPNTALMTAGTFLICRAITLPGALEKIFAHLATLSFGIFLVHYWVLTWLRDVVLKDILDPMPSALHILVLGTAVFLVSWGIAKLVSLMPGRKWLLG